MKESMTPEIPEISSVSHEVKKSPENKLKGKIQKKISAILLSGAVVSGAFAPSVSAGEWQRRIFGRDNPTASDVLRKGLGELRRAERKAETDRRVYEHSPAGKFDRSVSDLEARVGQNSPLLRSIREMKASGVQLTPDMIKRRPMIEPKEPVIAGFEDAAVNNEQLGRMIRGAYPKSWESNLTSLQLAEKEKRNKDGYGTKVSGEDACALVEGGNITFYPDCKNDVMKILDHEIAHTVGWESNGRLSLEERVELFEKVVARSQADNRFISRNVETIYNKDKKAEAYMRASEYWADAVQEYLNNPPRMEGGRFTNGNLPREDSSLIRDFIRKSDPGFNAERAYKVRTQIHAPVY